MGAAAPSRPLGTRSLALAGAAALAAAAVGAAALAAAARRRAAAQSPEDLHAGRGPVGPAAGRAAPLAAATGSAPAVPRAAAERDQELARQRWAASLVAAAAAGSAQAVSELLVAPPPGPAEGLLDVDANLPPSGQFPNVTAAYAAALHGHADVLKLLLEAGADPNIKGVKSSQWDGAFTLTEADTALVVACKEGHLDCVEGLLASGADPNVDCSSEYFEGAVEWGDEDDGTEQFFYTALDVTDRASVGSDKDPEHWRQLRALLVSHGARHTTQLQLAKRQGVRVKVTSGSRMGA